jgi:DHA2 family metal-tetracycline-proton antiporter-like MFS transporter
LLGLSVWVIACLLILGYVGQSAMSLVMSRSISLSLPAGQAGVGMGMLMMLNFVTGSIAIGIYSRIVDLDAGLAWNPLTAVPSSGMVYSNLFLVLAMLWVIVYLSYYLRMRKRKA